jgi:transcriptional regulator with XRE-family HTH domain
VRQLREELKLSQPEFAKELWLTLDQLTSIEYARSPLRYGLADWFCSRFDINQRWLAEGKQPQYLCLHFDPKIFPKINPAQLFSSVYDQYIRRFLERLLREIADRQGRSIEKIDAEEAMMDGYGVIQHISPDACKLMLARNISYYVDVLPPSLYQELATALGKAARVVSAKHAKEIAAFSSSKSTGINETSAAPEKQALTDASTIGKPSDVKAQLPGLLKRLKEATAARGMKSHLAEAMSVSVETVSLWLSGTMVPCGESVLKLARWVEQREAK